MTGEGDDPLRRVKCCAGDDAMERRWMFYQRLALTLSSIPFDSVCWKKRLVAQRGVRSDAVNELDDDRNL